MSPINARNKENTIIIRNRMYKNTKANIGDELYPIGTQVRIISWKDLMTKSYKGNWTKEIFKINFVGNDGFVTYYKIVDMDN